MHSRGLKACAIVLLAGLGAAVAAIFAWVVMSYAASLAAAGAPLWALKAIGYGGLICCAASIILVTAGLVRIAMLDQSPSP